MVAELWFGAARLPDVVRTQQLASAIQATVAQDFAGRILSFDLEAAVVYAQIASRCEAQGRPMDAADAQIAAMCLVQDAPLATRNTQHFEGLGLRVSAMGKGWTLSGHTNFPTPDIETFFYATQSEASFTAMTVTPMPLRSNVKMWSRSRGKVSGRTTSRWGFDGQTSTRVVEPTFMAEDPCGRCGRVCEPKVRR